MKLNHTVDVEFQYTSPFLKRVLSQYNIPREVCLDMPCGNGRNLFFLANNFKLVVGVDIKPNYIESIKTNSDFYQNTSLDLRVMDLSQEEISDLAKCNLICNIHYFDLLIINYIIAHMAKDSFLLVETPSCSGGNYNDLPEETVLQNVIKSTQILYYKFIPCANPNNTSGKGSLKMLIKKN